MSAGLVTPDAIAKTKDEGPEAAVAQPLRGSR
jgi:hypothetical protein